MNIKRQRHIIPAFDHNVALNSWRWSQKAQTIELQAKVTMLEALTDRQERVNIRSKDRASAIPRKMTSSHAPPSLQRRLLRLHMIGNRRLWLAARLHQHSWPWGHGLNEGPSRHEVGTLRTQSNRAEKADWKYYEQYLRIHLWVTCLKLRGMPSWQD